MINADFPYLYQYALGGIQGLSFGIMQRFSNQESFWGELGYKPLKIKLEHRKNMTTSLQTFHTTGSIIHVQVTFSVPKDKWLAQYSVKYPELQFELLSSLALSENQGNCLIQVKGEHMGMFWDDFSSYYDSKKYQIILQDSHTLLMNVIFDAPFVLWTIMDTQLIILFPIVIRKGRLSIDIIAPRKKIEDLFKKPYWKKLDLSIKRMGKVSSTPKLSPHQNRIVDYALEYGLFDIPRKKSLTEAAAVISENNPQNTMSVSALSENLRRISKKLVESYVKGREIEDRQI